jgi:hypothetical protein
MPKKYRQKNVEEIESGLGRYLDTVNLNGVIKQNNCKYTRIK